VPQTNFSEGFVVETWRLSSTESVRSIGSEPAGGDERQKSMLTANMEPTRATSEARTTTTMTTMPTPLEPLLFFELPSGK